MAKFTQQHYKEIAEVLDKTGAHVAVDPTYREGWSAAVSAVTMRLADLFAADNDSFKRELFMAACSIRRELDPGDEPPVKIGGTYKRAGYEGIAWRVVGFPVVQPECQGHPDNTGMAPADQFESGQTYYCDGSCQEPEADESQVVAVMVGDDRRHTFDADELTPINDDQFCSECGQIGCGCGRVEV